MKITRDNYEIYALDYLEGQLDPSAGREFEIFLNQNADIKAELKDFAIVEIPVDAKTTYDNKDQLYRRSRGLISLFLIRPNLNIAAGLGLLMAFSIGLYIFQTEETVTATGQMPMVTQPIGVPVEIEGPKNSQVEELASDVLALETDVVEDLSSRQEHPIASVLTKKSQGVAEVETSPVKTDVAISSESEAVAVESKRIVQVEELPIAQRNTNVEQVAFLTKSIPSVELSQDQLLSQMAQKNDLLTKKTSFEIHIPGSFLSDTWTDLSFAQFKKKLLPEFIKN